MRCFFQGERAQRASMLLFIDPFLPFFGRRVAINCSPHVCLLGPYRVTSIFPD